MAYNIIKTIKYTLLSLFLITAFSVPALGADWVMELKAATDTAARNLLYIGQVSGAADGYDGYDSQALLDGGNIEASFPHPEWGRTAIDYWIDVREGAGLEKTWNMHVESVLGGTGITLSWNNSAWPAGTEAVLMDMTTSTSTDMTATGVYTYTNDGPRDFTINVYSFLNVPGLAYIAGNDGSDPLGGDSLAGVARILTGIGGDTGNDDDNIINGDPRVDLEYEFTVTYTDSTGEAPAMEPTLYLAHRSRATASDFFPYPMTCPSGGTWGAGKTCTVTLKLGPATVHKFYFRAVGTTGSFSTMPTTKDLSGPTIEMLRGYNMSAVSRDITGAGLYGSDVFSSSAAYRWISAGLDTSFDVTFNGVFEQVISGATEIQDGEGYYAIRPGPGATVDELAAYPDYTASTKEIILASGWNIIANPYNGDVFMSDTMVRQDDGTPVTVNWDVAAGVPNEWVVSSIYYYDGSDWGYTFTLETPLLGATLVPWRSYWAYLGMNDGNTYTLIIPKP